MKSHTGIYIFEGIDNVGKTTIIQALENRINGTTEFNCTNIAFAYNNIMLIIASYAAQKRHCYDLIKELIKKCTNNAYVAMWKNGLKNRGRIWRNKG